MKKFGSVRKCVALICGLMMALCVALFAAGCRETDFRIVLMNDGEEYSVLTLSEGEQFFFPEDPEKEADEEFTYTFRGWSTEDVGVVSEDALPGLDLYHAGEELLFTGHTTLYAVYTAEPREVYYTVIFRDGLTKERIGDEQKVLSGEDAVPPAPPVHEGYEFVRWDKSYENITGRTEITALYEVKEFELVLHYLGEEHTLSVEFGSSLSGIEPTISDSFVFDGWYYDEEFQDPLADDATMPAKKLDLYAKIEIKEGELGLVLTGDGVYGNGDDIVKIVGLQTSDDLTYTYEWVGAEPIDGGATALVKAAGTQQIACTVTEDYGDSIHEQSTLQLSVNLKKATLTAQVTAEEGSIVYGATPEITVTLAGFCYEDRADGVQTNVIITNNKDSAPATGRLHVGEYTVTAELAQNLANYELGEVTGTTLTVTPKQLTVTASAEGFTYGASPAPELTFEGFAEGEGESVLTLDGERYLYEKGGVAHTGKFVAGTYTVQAGNFTGADYTVVKGEVAQFTVAKREITLAVTSAKPNYIYGETPTWNVEKTAGEYADGESIEAIEVSVSYGEQSAHPTVGHYTLTLTATSENYNVTTVNGSFDIAAKEITAAVQAGGASFTYGEAIAVSVQWGEFVEGESANDLFEEIPAITYTKGGEAYAKSGNYFDVGEYTATIDAAGRHGNYNVTVQNAGFEVTARSLTATVSVAEEPDGEAFTYGDTITVTATWQGYAEGESAQNVFGSAKEPAVTYKKGGAAYTNDKTYFEVGEYTATVEADGEYHNYHVTVTGTSFKVEPKQLTATVSVREKPNGDAFTYGDTITVTATWQGYAAGESAQNVFGTPAEPAVTFTKDSEPYTKSGNYFDIGEYTADIETGATSANYTVTVTGTSFTVEPKQLTATVSVREKPNGDAFTYGDTITVTATWQGYAAGENAQNVFGTDTEPAITYKKGGAAYTNDKKYFEVGEYTADIETEEAYGNYTVAVTGTSFKVDPYVFTVEHTVTQSRDDEYSFAPQFAAEEQRFMFTGTVVLKNNHDGSYNATDAASFAESFQWKEGNYKIALKDGGDEVTQNFTLQYALHVTLNASQFTVTEPDAQARTVTYDGQKHNFAVKVTHHAEEVAEAKIEYSIDGEGSYSTAEPEFEHVGKHTVYYKVTAEDYAAAQGSYTVEIKKASNTLTVNGGRDGFTYNGEGHSFELTASANFGTVTANCNNGIDIAQQGGKFTFTLINAGTYNVVFTVEGTSDYDGATETVTIVVEKVTGNKIAVGGAHADFTYDGAEHTFTLTATANFGAVKAVCDNGIAVTSEDGFKFTLVNVGTYTVTFTVDGTDNYNEAKETVTITVEKFTENKITVEGNSDGFTYDGEEHAYTLNVSANFGEVTANCDNEIEVANEDGAFTFTLIDAGTYTVTFNVVGTDNYNEATETVTIVVEKVINNAITVEGEHSDFIYDGTAHTFALTVTADFGTVTAKLNGTQAIQPEENVFKFTAQDVGAYTVEFTVEGTNNYNEATETVTVNVSKNTANKITVGGEHSDFTYDGNDHTFTLTATATFGTVTASCDNEIEVTNEGGFKFTLVNAGTYTVTFTVDGTNNYNAATETVTINVKEVTDNKITVSGEHADFTYNGEDHTFTLNVTANFGTVTAKLNDTQPIEAQGDEFTFTAKNAGTYTVKFAVEGTNNYNGAAETVTVNVSKANYEGITHDELSTTMKHGATLADLNDRLQAHFRWADAGEAIKVGENGYNAIYNADEANYNDFSLQITVNAAKRQVKASLAATVEADFGSASDALFTPTFTADGYTLQEDEIAYLTQNISRQIAGANYTVGGTYIVTVKCTLPANDYYELAESVEAEILFKLKSVDVGGTLYTIEDALATAQSGATVTVKNNTSFAEKAAAEKANYTVDGGHYTIKAGVTLFLPYDTSKDSDRAVGQNGAVQGEAGLSGTTHKDATTWQHSSLGDEALCDLTVTVPAGIELINAGTLNIGGITTGSNGGSNPSGQTCSGYARLVLGANAKLTSTGTMNLYGFIQEQGTNNGSKVVIQSGTTRMPFVAVEHRGGTKFSNIYDNMIGSPFNRFYLQNITSVYEIKDGASLLGHANMYASGGDNSTDVKFIGGEAHFMQLQSGTYVTAKYDMSTKVTTWNCYGSVKINALQLSISIATLSTEGIMFPVSWYHNFNFHANGGAATVDATAQDMKILPGGSICIDKDVTFKIAKLFVYDETFTDPASSTGAVAAPLYETKNGASQALGAGKLVVDGTLEVAELGGLVQTTSDGATLKVGTAQAASYELVAADTLKWKAYRSVTLGKVWNNNGSLSGQKAIKAGTYKSKSGGWLTADSEFGIEFSYVYHGETGEAISQEGTPEANNPGTFPKSGMKLQAATLAGFEFKGWFTDPECSHAIEEITANEYENYLEVNSKLKLYGLFEKIPAEVQTYTVEFYANGDGATIGGLESSKANIRSDKLEEFVLANYVPVRENYDFEGWATDAGGSSVKDTLTADDFNSGALKLYAKWTIKNYALTITLNCDSDTTGTVKVTINDQAQDISAEGDTVLQVPYGATVKIEVTPGKDCALESIASEPEGYIVASGDTIVMPGEALKVTVHIEEDGGLCLAEGTLVLMADGTTKKVEDLKSGDLVLVFNHETGTYDVAPVLYNVHSGDKAENAIVVRLTFSDGTEIGISYQHFFYDLTLNRYVLISAENVKEFIGHTFAKVNGANGEYETVGVTLTDVSIKEECIRYYSPVSVYHTNIIAEGLLTYTTWPVYGNPEGFMNYFAFDADMKYDEEAMLADIAQYGLYTYEDFKDVLSEAAFYAGPWKYFKVAVGKGQLSWEDILNVIDWLYNSGELEAL